MYDVKDRIAKLLALADSPNENEAKVALLKARELMAEHKLRPEECKKKESTKVIVDLTDVTCTKTTDAWAVELSAVIAAHYCCKAYRNHRHNAKKVTIGFAGLEDDFEICKRVYLYAYDCVKARCKEIASEHRGLGYVGSEIREMCNAYGWGFVRGLNSAYQKQTEQHQEWGLVMVVPKAVEDATSHHKKGSAYGVAQTDGWRRQYAAAGYKDGEKFDPAHRLERAGTPVPEIEGDVKAAAGDKVWVRWSQWNNGGMVAFGQMLKRDMQKKLQDFEVEARKLLKQTGADHVVYGVKHFSEKGELEEIRFYLKPMDEDEFERSVANVPGWQVYAVHRMI